MLSLCIHQNFLLTFDVTIQDIPQNPRISPRPGGCRFPMIHFQHTAKKKHVVSCSKRSLIVQEIARYKQSHRKSILWNFCWGVWAIFLGYIKLEVQMKFKIRCKKKFPHELKPKNSGGFKLFLSF